MVKKRRDRWLTCGPEEYGMNGGQESGLLAECMEDVAIFTSRKRGFLSFSRGAAAYTFNNQAQEDNLSSKVLNHNIVSSWSFTYVVWKFLILSILPY